VTSADEPGHPESGDSPNGNGSVERTGVHRSDPRPATGRAPGGDAPPWQRGGARSPQPQQRPKPETPAASEPRPAHSPGVEARLSRFISGTAAPTAASMPAAQHPKAPTAEPDTHADRPTEAYKSELPDLSGPTPRPAPPRKPPTDRPQDTSSAVETGRSGGRLEVGAGRSRGPLRASMQIRRIDPWSTLKVSLVLSVALFFVWMIAVAFLYLVLGGMGVWSKLNSNVGDLLNNTSGSTELVSSGTIFGGALLIGLVNIVLLTAMATIGAFVYNLTTDLIGGVEVTLADRD
jgi:hypothetical protein